MMGMRRDAGLEVENRGIKPPLWIRIARISGFVGAGVGGFVGVMEVAFGVSDLLGGLVLINGALIVLLGILLVGCLTLLRPKKRLAPILATAVAGVFVVVFWLDGAGVDIGSPPLATVPFDPKRELFAAASSIFSLVLVAALWIGQSARSDTRGLRQQA